MNEFDDVISEASSAYGIEPALLKGVLQQESSFKPSIISGETKSRTGAIGIAQFMPATAKEVGIDPTNPIQSIFGAAFYLKKNIDQFGSVSKGLSAYNYGPSNVEKLINKHGEDWVDKLPPETSKYLMKVAGYRDDFSNEFQSKEPQDQSDAQPNGPKLKSAFDNDDAQPAGTLQYSQFSPDIANVIGAPQTNNALIAKAATAKIQGPMRPGPTIDNAIQKQASDNLVGDELSRAADVDKLPASQGNFISDPINLLARGGVGIGETVAEVMSRAPTVLSSYGPFSKLAEQGANIMQQRAGLDKVFGDAKQLYTEQLSPEQRNASEAKIWDSNTNTFGPALSNPRSYYGGILESLPGMAAAMGPGIAVAKTAFAEALAKGLSEKAATNIAASAGMKAGMFSQGVLGAGQTGSSVRQETMQLPDSVFDASDKFQELLKSGLSREDAKKSLADDASKLGFVLGAGTGVFGGAGERFMAKAFTGGVAGNLATRIAKGAVSNGILEQLPLSASQQLADNYAKSTVNPNQSLSENVINQGLSGASMGVIMGGATGAMGHAPAETVSKITPAELEVARAKLRALADSKRQDVNLTNILGSKTIDDALNVDSATKQPIAPPGNIYDANNPLVDMDGLLASITAKSPDETGKPLYSGDLTNAPTDAIGGLAKVTNTSDLEHPNVYPNFGESPPPGGGGGGDQFATRESLRDPNAVQELPPLNDRRIDTANSKLVADMTPDEKSQALLTDYLTGIPNGRARDESPRLPVQTQVDVDNFGAFNKTFGHGAGDQVLQVVAKHLQDSQGDGRVYRIGGDEFPGEFNNEADAKAAMETARAKLADTKFTFQLPDGTQKEITGIGFSYGTGKDIQSAENSLIADKAAREASGLRRSSNSTLAEVNTQLAERQQANPSQLADELARARKPVQGETDGEKMERLASQGESSQVDLDAKQADLVPDKALPDALQKQVDAGTVKATRTEVAGMPVKIIVARDDTRTGTTANGNPYSQKMGAHYGELTGTENANGEPVKTFLGPTADNATKVFVIDQVKADGSPDEPKVMIGYKNAQSARDAYMMNYPRGWKGIGGITEMPMEKFKEWVNSPAAAQPLSEAVRARMPTTTPADANEVVIGSYGSMPSKNNQLLTLKRNGSEYTLFQGKNEAIDGNSGEPITYKSVAEGVADVKAEMSREDRRFLSDRQKAFLTPEFKGENNGSADVNSIRKENEQSQKEQDAKVLEGVDGSDNLDGDNSATAVNTIQYKDLANKNGQIKTFDKEKDAKRYLNDNESTTKGYKPRKDDDVWVLSKEVKPRSKAQLDADEQRRIDAITVYPTHDNLWTAIAKLGGLSKREAISTWGADPKDKRPSGVFRSPTLRYSGETEEGRQLGLPIDSMGEKLAELGYLPKDEHGKYDVHDFEDAFKEGNEYFTSQGIERRAALSDEMRYQEDEAKRKHNLNIEKEEDSQALEGIQGVENLDADSLTKSLDIADQIGDSELGGRSVSNEDFMRQLGATEDEINEAKREDESARAAQTSAASTENERVANSTSSGAEQNVLTNQTASELAQSQSKAADKARQANDDKRIADNARDGFALDGGESGQIAPINNEGNQKALFNKSDKPIFYSQMERQIDTLMGKQEPSKELAIKVEAWAKSGKFKQDELYASGLTDWLKLQDGKVTKDQVLGFIRDNGVKVQEVMLGTESKASEAMRLAVTGERNSELLFTPNQWTEQSERFERTAQKWQRNGDTKEAERYFALSEEAGRLAEGLNSESGSTQGMPKFSRYQEPGGKNYKEMLITLPNKESIGEKPVQSPQGWGDTNGGNIGVERTGNTGADFRSSHFDQPNILAHIRFNERIDADGKKVLFVEEIQSDWAQKGKKDGFAMPEAERKEADALMGKANAAGGIRNLSAEDQARGAELGKRITTEGVPNGPFVGKTEAWVSLALKRMIRYAADNGFDRIAFTTGDQQAARYDLSKSVDRINYDPKSTNLIVTDKDSRKIIDKKVPVSELPDMIGKEAADRLLKTELSEVGAGNLVYQAHILEGNGLKVGGEGMKTFYDKIVPNIANDVIKKLGGDKMGTVQLDDAAPFVGYNQYVVGDGAFGPAVFGVQRSGQRMMIESAANGEAAQLRVDELNAKRTGKLTQPSFDITPAMRDKVSEGMPLFNKNETNNEPKNETKYQAEPDTDGALKKLIGDIEDQTGKAIPESAVERVRLPDQLALEKIAGAFDTRIVGLTDPNNVLGINGATFPEGNVIYLNANSERPHMAVMFHELGHQLEAKNPALYAQLEGAIREQIDQGKYPEFAAKYENMRASDVRGEFVSEFLADAAMTDQLGPFWSAFNKTNRSAFQKVVDFLRQMVDTVRKVAYTNETKAYMKDFDAVLGTAGEIMGKFAKSSQTDTPAFKSWFGDSKVVDAEGNPMVVYHGTTAQEGFNKFGFDKNVELARNLGLNIDGRFFFAESADTASSYANEEAGSVMPTYLSIKNPLIVDAKGNSYNHGYDSNAGTNGVVHEAVNKAIDEGHDGVIVRNVSDHVDSDIVSNQPTTTVFVAFKQDQIKSAIGNNGDFNPKNPDIRFNQVAPTNSELAAVEHARFNKADIAEAKETPSLPDETFFQKNQRIVQDKDVRFKVVQDWLESKGVKLSELADIYTVAALYSGRVAVRQEDFRQQIFSPINAELQKAGHTLDDVGTILHAQHAEERNIKVAEINPKMPDGGSGMKTADARDIMAKADPELVEIANKIRAITDMTLDLKLQSGEITKERYNQLKYEGYKFYAPLKGGDETVQSGAGKGFDVKSTMKRALGHSFRDEMIVENILRDHEMAIITAEKNRVAQTLLQFAVETNDPNLITIGQPEKRAVLTKGTPIYAVKYEGSVIEAYDNVNDARNAMNKLMFDASQVGSNKWSVAKVTDQGVRYQASPILAANEAGVYLSGQFVRMQINDPLMARAYLNQGVDHLIGVLKVGKEVNTFLSKAYTGWNPSFIFKNAIRDATEGVINLTGDYGATTMLKVLSKYPEAFGSLLRYAATGKMTDSISNYRADGGKIGAAYLPDLDRVGQDIRKVYNDYAGVADTLKRDGSFSALRVASDKTISKLTHFIEVANMATENSMRLATYETMRENGMSRNKSALAAKDVTLNFNRKGEIGTQASALWLFFNPSVQGAARSIQTLLHSEHKTQAWALTGAMTLLFYAMAKINASADKERWEQTPDYEKSHNLIIPAGKYQVKIPIPYGYGFFGNLGTAIHELQGGKDLVKVGYMLANAFAEGYSPIGNPFGDKPDYKNLAEIVPGTPLKIGAEILANRSGLGGPIVPPDQKEGKPDSTTMFRNTKETVWDKITGGMNKATGGNKAVAGWVDVHPDTMKYLWATATGGTGRFITDSMQIANLTAQGATPDLREVPILRDFLRTQQVTDTQKAFMDAVSDSKIAQTQFDTAKKNLEEVMKGKNEKVQDEARETLDTVREKNRVFLKLGSAITEYQKADSARKDEIDAIMADTSTPLQERRLKAKEVEKVESDLYNRYISLFKEKEDEQKKDELERAKKKN